MSRDIWGIKNAQQLFIEHMIDYQNGPFSQAASVVRDNLQDVISSLNPHEFAYSIFDVMVSVPSATTGIFSSVLFVGFFAVICFKIKNFKIDKAEKILI